MTAACARQATALSALHGKQVSALSPKAVSYHTAATPTEFKVSEVGHTQPAALLSAEVLHAATHDSERIEADRRESAPL